ncbi:hypothetical protein JYU20_02135, partial [Bacteroidales bacterium AH-315-I05]|nr:hypothetical protein [Bacteroidales bacterium AH-315-I05]
GDGSTILLPRKSTAGDPTGANGMLYYNSNSNKFRAFENSTWTNLIGGGGGANTLDQAYDQGGAGAGRIIAADAGPVTITGTGVVTANQGRMHVTTVGGTAPTPSAAISGSIGTAGSIGYGLTGEITNSDNSGAAIFGSSNGTGQTINANMTGTGVAGRFDVSNAGNAFSAVTGTTNGSGSAILGRTTGTGRAGEFNNTNAANATETIYSSTNNPAATAALFENVAAAGAGLGAGLRGRSTQSAGVGVIGSNFHASGTGTAGAGNNQGPLTLAAGSGVSGTSDNVGVFGVSTSAAAGKMGGLFWLGTGATVYSRVAYNNAGTGYGIFSNFTKSTVVKGLNGEDRIMFCPEAPEILFEDYGKGQLVNGFSHIELDPIFANTVKINSKHPLRVFIQLEGDCNGVYVTAKSATGFDVIELSAGKSNTAFMYHVIANRIDATDEEGNVISIHEALRFPIGPDSAEDQQLLPLPKKEGKRNLSKMQKPQFPKNR